MRKAEIIGKNFTYKPDNKDLELRFAALHGAINEVTSYLACMLQEDVNEPIDVRYIQKVLLESDRKDAGSVLLDEVDKLCDKRVEEAYEELNQQQQEIEALKTENEKLNYLLGCADYIQFVSPDILERDHDSEDENHGKWRYQREWMYKPRTGFETALEAFEAMRKESLDQPTDEKKIEIRQTF